MNRKRKFNEVYKGVFKNDKKSCLVDLKPLDKKREIEQEIKGVSKAKGREKSIDEKVTKRKTLDLNLKIAKNLGFGTYFKKLREEIVDVFLSDEEYVSFEGLFNFNQMNELFNFQKDKDSNIENINPNINIENINNNITTENIKIRQNEDYEDELLYEDENETIYKRRKTNNSKSNMMIYNNMDDEMKMYTNRNINPMNKNAQPFMRSNNNNVNSNNFHTNIFAPNNINQNNRRKKNLSSNIIDCGDDISMNMNLRSNYEQDLSNKYKLVKTKKSVIDENLYNNYLGFSNHMLSNKVVYDTSRNPLGNISNNN